MKEQVRAVVNGRENWTMDRAASFLKVIVSATLILSVAALFGCRREPERPPTERLEPITQAAVPPYLENTIGSQTLLGGLEWTPVRGIGLVYGLAGTGSTVHPPGLRERIIKDLAQYSEVTSPEAVLSDPSTTIVEILGFIPPGAVSNEPFDVQVRVADGVQATSLEGGILKGADLRRIDVGRGTALQGMVLARAEGPIFVPPFIQSNEEGGAAPAGRVDPRLGRILGGGRLTATEPPSFQLTLLEPSVRVAEQIVRLINARFPGAARGRSDSSIAVRVPAEYAMEKEHFLRIVTSIYLIESPDLRERRMRLLVDQLRTGPDYLGAVYGLLAFGQTSAALVEPLMRGSGSEETRFHAALTLARLGRPNSALVLREFMARDSSPYQAEAARALGYLPDRAGLVHLEAAFDIEKPTVRIAAWHALLRIAPERLPREKFGQRMELSQVDSKATPFIYISRQKVPRVVIFGKAELVPPVLVNAPSYLVTARPQDKLLTVMSRRIGPDAAVQVDPRADAVVRALMIDVFEMNYADVVGFLDQAREQGALKAPLVLEPLVDEVQLQGTRQPSGGNTGGPPTVPGTVE